MKKWIWTGKCIPAFTLLPLIFSVISCRISDIPPEDPPHVEPLLETRWGQRYEYSMYAPENSDMDDFGGHERLGCISVAAAQIAYFHRLQPSGSVDYICGTGPHEYHIQEELIHQFDFSEMKNQIRDLGFDNPGAQETALYCYYAAVIMHKDFGTDTYVIEETDKFTSTLASYISAYYGVETDYYLTTWESIELADIEAIIVNELEAGRPVLLHLKTADESSAHAVVADGIRVTEGILEIHCNFGWYGDSDGWYPATGPFGGLDHPDFRRVITIAP